MKTVYILTILFLACAAPAFAQHQVTLTWTQSTDPVDHNCIFRGSTTGGPYAQLFCSPAGKPTTSYVDLAVAAGDQWFYVTTAVSAKGVSSKNSNEASAVIPLLPPTSLQAVSQ